MYSPQNIFNANNFNQHKKPISLLNVPICTQGMQRTWWPEAGTIIVTGPYWLIVVFSLNIVFQTHLSLWIELKRVCDNLYINVSVGFYVARIMKSFKSSQF